MNFGVILLCHAPLGRATEVARHWARHGVPVAVHVDAATPDADVAMMRAALADLPQIGFVARRRTEWGRWGLVAATLDGAHDLITRAPGVGHVLLTSGSCLPIRPIADLGAHLATHPQTDFIETVRLGSRRWTKGGLEDERFTRHFPVSWRRNPWLFDALVRLQRRLGIRRRLPQGLVAHLGQQWWCLTQTTLRAILNDPDRARLEAYFRGVWIPDESFFQSLAVRHATQIAPPLTFQRFDTRGVPHILYDDHRDMLASCPAYLARKIWPGAEGLYRAFLDAPQTTRAASPDPPDALERAIKDAHRLRREGRVGLRSMGRLPDPHLGLPTTARPYGLFWGVEAALAGFDDWLAQMVRADGVAPSGLAVQGVGLHGRLFAPGGAVFAGGGDVGPGALPAAAALRDHAPIDFLSNLIWATRDAPQIFHATAEDGARVAAAVAADPHARGVVVTGTGRDAQARAAEAAGLAALRAPDARHGLIILTLAEFLADPQRHIARALADILGVDPGDLPPLPTAPQVQP